MSSRADKKRRKLERAAEGRSQHPGKSPRSAAVTTRPDKRPRSLGIDHEDAWHRRPVWRFADLDAKHPSGCLALDVEGFRTLHEALGSYETQTCSEIWGQHDNGCKRYDVDATHDNITRRLTELDRDDETAVHTLRITGEYRVYGVLRENIFYVLWLDPEHEMYPSKKKNT